MKTDRILFRNRLSIWIRAAFCRAFFTRKSILPVALIIGLNFAGVFADGSSATASKSKSPTQSKPSERTKGFYKHQEKIRNWEEERESGYPAQLRLQEKREQEMAEAANKYRKSVNHKKIDDPEGTPEYKAHIDKKIKAYEKAEEIREKFAEEKKTKDSKIYDLDETIEYGLTEDRPRFPYKNRATYGGKSLIKSSRPGGESSSSGFSYGGSADYNSPPPSPPIDDPPQDSNDYPMPDSGDDPPPPPPPPPSPDDFGSEPVPPPPQEPPGEY